MAEVVINSGTDADVAFRLYTSLLQSGRAKAGDREQALALFRECIEAVQHKAPSSVDVRFAGTGSARE